MLGINSQRARLATRCTTRRQPTGKTRPAAVALLDSRPVRAHPADAGFSLVEVVIGIALIGTIVSAVLFGVMQAAASSARTRDITTAQWLARNAAEAVKGDTYARCATSASYLSAWTPPPPYDTPTFAVRVTGVEFWNGTSGRPGDAMSARFRTACATPADDSGLQKITLTATVGSGSRQVTRTMVAYKRAA